MFHTDKTNLTELMLRHCYHCDNACECDERMIIACMEDQGAEFPVVPNQTRELLRLYEQ
ncbi:hypothetical protein [Cohnella panacarvi]|uniref:hypothetical protein n=1 Tax=Cohnella panacarvi TaxID=400776 RepID=UPI0004B52113|nr:hypothetical protein [Cohnella panacarvi]